MLSSLLHVLFIHVAQLYATKAISCQVEMFCCFCETKAVINWASLFCDYSEMFYQLATSGLHKGGDGVVFF